MAGGIQGFSFNLGVAGVFDSVSEIGRQNLPQSGGLVPAGDIGNSQIYGRVTGSVTHEQLDNFLQPEIKNRELQIPSVFTAVLSRLLGKLNQATTASEKEKALAECLAAVQEDKELCDTFRNLLVGG